MNAKTRMTHEGERVVRKKNQVISKLATTVILSVGGNFVLGLLNQCMDDVKDVFQSLVFLATGMDLLEHVTWKVTCLRARQHDE